MASIKCPNCGRDFVRRVSRAGLVEKLLSLFYVYPFRCQLCSKRFRFFQRGVRYRRVMEDRREYQRMEMKFPVTITGQDDFRAEGIVLNLSMGGCSVATDADLDAGMIVKMKLAITGMTQPVSVEAAIVRNFLGNVAGLEFLRWQGTERERLQLFIRGLLIKSDTEWNLP